MGKRGPKKSTIKAREPNGRASRKPMDAAERHLAGMKREESDILGIGIAARIRLHGVHPDHSKDQMAGTYVGRMCLAGQLTQAQYDAAMTYLADSEAYRFAVQAPKETGAVNLNATGGISDYEDVEKVRRAITRMDGTKVDGKPRGGARLAVQEKQNELRGTANLWAALSLIVIEDRNVPTLYGDLRYALNALVKHYGLEARQRAA